MRSRTIFPLIDREPPVVQECLPDVHMGVERNHQLAHAACGRTQESHRGCQIRNPDIFASKIGLG